MLQKAITLAVRPALRPWEAWAESDTVRPKLQEALQILDRDGDGRVCFADLEARAGQSRHGLMMKGRQLRPLFAMLDGRGADDGAVRRERIQAALEGLTAEQLASVIAELPRWLQSRPMPALISGLGGNAIATSASDMLNAMLERIQAPRLEPDVAAGLVAQWGASRGPSPSR